MVPLVDYLSEIENLSQSPVRHRRSRNKGPNLRDRSSPSSLDDGPVKEFMDKKLLELLVCAELS